MNRLIRQTPLIIKRGLSNKSKPLKFHEIPYHLQYETRDFESKTINFQNIPKELTIPKNISSELFAIINHDPKKVITNSHNKDYKTNDKYSVRPRNSPW